ncbi:uncharacterized protein [Pyrus communis]|uniref:uncharacterized protein n=1 Tax=Pyrus communis TaxID=23211 RepID=UPI0035C08475
MDHQKMEREREKQRREEVKQKKEGDGGGGGGHSEISRMKPLTYEAYGGGMYGREPDQPAKEKAKPRASERQSADGPAEATTQPPKHTPPPSTGDRDLDITGQSYIQ